MCYNMPRVTARKNNMNTKICLGGAIALSLTFAVGSASADDIRFGGADWLITGVYPFFESGDAPHP